MSPEHVRRQRGRQPARWPPWGRHELGCPYLGRDFAASEPACEREERDPMTQPRRRRQVRTAAVVRTEQLTPHLIRVVLGGEGLTGLTTGAFSDHYVKLLFPPEGVAYPEPFDVDVIRRELPRDQWPRSRTYTVRAWDPDALELTIDFVY